MNIRFREDPREWRKSVLLTTVGLAVLSSILRWRRALPAAWWGAVLLFLALVSAAACVRPGWFRGFYRISLRMGYYSSQAVARVVLAAIFLLLLAPAGVLVRLLGKDLLRLKRPSRPTTYWNEIKGSGPLDRMF